MEQICSTFIFKHKILRYLVAGGIGATVNIGTLFVLTHFAGLYYVLSSVVAFVFGTIVSFFLQKYFTFNDFSEIKVLKQPLFFLVISVTNLAINTGGIYILVEGIGIHYVVAQIIMGGLIAVSSFYIYKKIIFRIPA